MPLSHFLCVFLLSQTSFFPLILLSLLNAKAHDELLADNRRMAEMLATSEGDSKEMASLLERLSEDRKKLQKECHDMRRRVRTDGGRGKGSGEEELPEVSFLEGGGGW